MAPAEAGQPAASNQGPLATTPRPAHEAKGMGLRPPRSGLGARLRAVLSRGRTASEATWDAIEEELIAADIGAATALELVDVTRQRLGRTRAAAEDDVRRALMAEVRARLERAGAGSFELGASPSVILLVGVNGSGKTTTAAKLAARLRAEGRSVILAAADTFRAAAIEQLRVWGDAAGVQVVAQRAGADPSAVAFDAVAAAMARRLDAVLIDTAGRLHNKPQLMAELAKIRRVVERRLPGQPAHVLLVLDATTGQNGLLQAEAFSRDAGVTGLVLTKLDGTAKGGVALAIVERLQVPILFAGVGEEIGALAPFDAEAYVEWLFAG